MKAGAGLSTNPDGRAAAIEAAFEARGRLDETPNLAVVFASPHFSPHVESLLDAVHEAAGPETLIGCIAEGIVGGNHEVETEPAVSVWLGDLPARVETFNVDFDPDRGFIGFPGDARPLVMLCDPFTFPADVLLRGLNEAEKKPLVIGGMASGGSGPGQTRLFLDDQILSSGAVGASFGEGMEVLTVVSQGCKPVGQTFTVTKAEGNVIFELGGKPPVERIRHLYASLDPPAQQMLASGVLVGRVIDEYKADFTRGDFLVRGVIGADPECGAIAIGDSVEVGETIQFHLRDAASAEEDLRETLAHAQQRLGERTPAGALLFTCNGRGSRMFDVPNHDAGLVSDQLGGLPLAGFFCAGELGPVGGKNFLHGFTASMALFCEPTTN